MPELRERYTAREGDLMSQERKKIAIRHLDVGDMVVGLHVDKGGTLLKVVAGEINRKITEKDTDIVMYHVKGKTYMLLYKDLVDFSGILDENEVEVINQGICKMIIELYDQAMEKMIAGREGHFDIAQKINEMRHKSRAELEEKYTVVEAQ